MVEENKKQKEENKQQIIEAKIEQKLKSKVEKELQLNLNYAKKIQLSILPKYLPKTKECEFSAYYSPIETIGGDLYDAQLIDNNYLVFYIADAAGHGVSAAMLMVYIKQNIEMFTYYQNKKVINSPMEVVKKLNIKLISDKFEGHPQVTMFYCVYNISEKILTYTSTGHPQAVYLSKGIPVQSIGQTSMPIGWKRRYEIL